MVLEPGRDGPVQAEGGAPGPGRQDCVPLDIDVLLRLLVLCCRSVLTHWHNSCSSDLPAQAVRIRKAGGGKSMKPKLLSLYIIAFTQVTEEYK